jgi:predicted Rossmann fold nucleotide-binding protein DprA/Smf involved in DNA uptake
MKWILFTGTWRLTNKEVEEDVRKAVREVLFNGNGIITGGALGVDLIAVDELIKNDINCKNLRVIIPSKIDLYMTHLWKAVEEGRISKEEFTSLEVL